MTLPIENKLIYYLRKWTEISEQDEITILSAFEHASIKKKKEINGMNDTYMKKLLSLNQLTKDLSDGDKYYMSPHINGD